jgi:phosphate acetyltransferase
MDTTRSRTALGWTPRRSAGEALRDTSRQQREAGGVSDSLYITSMEAHGGKTVVALGVMEVLAQRVDRIGLFRPVVAGDPAERPDPLIELLRRRYELDVDPQQAVGCTYDDAARLMEGGHPGALVEHVVDRYAELRERHDVVLVVGSDFTGPAPATELGLNAMFAANLGAPVLNVVTGRGRSRQGIRAALEAGRRFLGERGCAVLASVVNRVEPGAVETLRAELRGEGDAAPVYVLRELPVLAALTLEEVRAALDAAVCTTSWGLERELDGCLVGSGLLPTVLDLLQDDQLLVTSADRVDLAVAVAAAASVPELPSVAGVVLTNEQVMTGSMRALVATAGVPVLTVAGDTYSTVRTIESLRGAIEPTSRRKIAAVIGEFSGAVDADELGRLITAARTDVVTPLMFTTTLRERARADCRRIVLPEGDDDRILLAAEEVVHQGIADLTILGDVEQVRARVAQLGLELGSTEIVDPVADTELRRAFAEEYARLRAGKGVTVDMAFDLMSSRTYFGTMLVHTGRVDGMVSGATHTTAATIRPALEVIRTAEGVSLVSSAFLMCLPEQVLVFADCAVNPDPTAEQLADIALSAAAAADAFGIEPRVAVVSYSTGTSGMGADVEKVRAATELVAARAPHLPLAGPIQYDAAVEPSVGAAKMPGNPVAGRATVLVFPDLNTGNTTYKAVQRAADAIAIGPVLLGLRKPVNDLSRGCTVPDIVNTVTITAIQAQRVAVPAGEAPAA